MAKNTKKVAAPALKVVQGEDPDAAKYARIKDAISACAESLKAEGSNFFIGALSKDPTRADGGNVFVEADLIGEDFTHILNYALPTKQDVINLGIWVGQVIAHRAKNEKANG